MAACSPAALGSTVLTALGLGDLRVRKLTLVCEVDEVPTVEVEMVLDGLDENEDLVIALRRYELVEVT